MRKRITYKNIFGAGVAVLAFSFATAGIANAQGVDAPSCESLGYDLTEADCAGRLFLKCPFDQTKYFCPDEPVSGSSCTNPKVGDILYSDKSCSSDVVSGKTPIAVVFNADRRLAIGLKTEEKEWMSSFTDVPRPHHTLTLADVPDLTNYTSGDSAKNDWAGKSNTNIVLNYCRTNSKSCPAFEYVSNYTTAGTNTGDWYLPALGELNNIYENRAVLNTTLSLIYGTQLSTTSVHWSSSEYNSSQAWNQYFYAGYVNYSNVKVGSFYVRPVLEF